MLWWNVCLYSEICHVFASSLSHQVQTMCGTLMATIKLSRTDFQSMDVLTAGVVG